MDFFNNTNKKKNEQAIYIWEYIFIRTIFMIHIDKIFYFIQNENFCVDEKIESKLFLIIENYLRPIKKTA